MIIIATVLIIGAAAAVIRSAGYPRGSQSGREVLILHAPAGVAAIVACAVFPTFVTFFSAAIVLACVLIVLRRQHPLYRRSWDQ